MTIESEQDLIGLKAIGRIVTLAMKYMQDSARVGMTTKELDEMGAEFLAKYGARSAPILTYNYPGHTCISINDEAAHGIPGKRVIQPGDLVNIDVSAELDGYIGDTGGSIAMPPFSPKKQRLLDYTRQALDAAVHAVRAGRPISVIGEAVDKVAKRGGYKIIEDLGGHGVGHGLHEEPHRIPHHFDRRAREKLTEGLVITLEPFLTTGARKVYTAKDGWTLKTVDGSLSAQFEHTVVITKGQPILLTVA